MGQPESDRLSDWENKTALDLLSMQLDDLALSKRGMGEYTRSLFVSAALPRAESVWYPPAATRLDTLVSFRSSTARGSESEPTAFHFVSSDHINLVPLKGVSTLWFLMKRSEEFFDFDIPLPNGGKDPTSIVGFERPTRAVELGVGHSGTRNSSRKEIPSLYSSPLT